MISFEESLQITLNSAKLLDAEMVPLAASNGRYLAEDILSDIDMPPFDKSAMDGYACRLEDIKEPLTIVETIPAGVAPQKEIRHGECSKIMTGSVVPKGADCVVMVEYTKREDNKIYITNHNNKSNICYKAEDISQGDKVLSQGVAITPTHMAVLASVGCDPVPVIKRPVIGIIATGDELVEPHQKPNASQIRNSNSAQLFGQAIDAGCVPRDLGIVKDTEEAIKTIITKEKPHVDIFMLSGGVSMGDFDHVPKALKDCGFKLLFEKVAIKPGKPTVFGTDKEKYVFGLPGNPVSTYMIFELFVKPFCIKLMGGTINTTKIKGILAEDITRKGVNRLAHIPININSSGEISRINYHGSAHIHALTMSNGFIRIPIGIEGFKKGEEIEITLTNNSIHTKKD